MTDSTTLAPTDSEILDAAEDFRSQYMHGGTTFDEFDEIGFTRAVLAKWGTPAHAIQPVAVASDSAPSLANDPRLCCRSHPHEKQSLHCQLREVAAWLRWHSAAGKTPSAESMRAHAEQVDAVALELRVASAGMPELGTRIVNEASWKFVEAMPHQIPRAIWNDLKPALYAAFMYFHGQTSHAAAAPSGQAREPLIARQLGEWHEDDGPVMWWAWCGHGWAGEPAWCGTPNSSGWPGYHTHWTPHPELPAAHGITATQKGGQHGTE